MCNPEQEVWLPIPQYEGSYEASSLGRIRGLDRINSYGRRVKGRTLQPAMGAGGRLVVGLSKNGASRSYGVHVLVARAFHGPPPGETGVHNHSWQVNHIDGDYLNNHADNLEWLRKIDNMRHGVERGLFMRGEDHFRAVVDEDMVRKIRSAYAGEPNYNAIGRQFGVNPGTVSAIINGITWKHVDGGPEVAPISRQEWRPFEYNGVRLQTEKWDPEDLIQALSLYERWGVAAAAEQTEVPKNTIRRYADRAGVRHDIKTGMRLHHAYQAHKRESANRHEATNS